MSKRTQFIIAALILAVVYFFTNSVSFTWKYLSILGFGVLTWFVSAILLDKLTTRKSNLAVATLLPFSFALAMNLFHFLFLQGLFWQIILSLTCFVSFYTIFLAENVFLVSAEHKTVPLYRTASTVGFLLTLTAAFFFFDVLLSFRFPAWLNGLIVFAICMVSLTHFLWTVSLSETTKVKNLSVTFVLSLIIGEIATVLSFWPVGINRGSLYLVSLLYVFGGLTQAYLRQRLFKKTIWEFIWMGLGIFLALFLATSWRGNF